MADPGEGLARPVPTTLFFDVFHEPLSWVRMTPPPPLKVWIRHWGITITLRIFPRLKNKVYSIFYTAFYKSCKKPVLMRDILSLTRGTCSCLGSPRKRMSNSPISSTRSVISKVFRVNGMRTYFNNQLNESKRRFALNCFALLCNYSRISLSRYPY